MSHGKLTVVRYVHLYNHDYIPYEQLFFFSWRKKMSAKRFGIPLLKRHGHDFGQFVFFCFCYLKCFKNAFLMIK